MSQIVWATIMPFGPVTLIFYWPKQIFSGQPKALISGTVKGAIFVVPNHLNLG